MAKNPLTAQELICATGGSPNPPRGQVWPTITNDASTSLTKFRALSRPLSASPRVPLVARVVGASTGPAVTTESSPTHLLGPATVRVLAHVRTTPGGLHSRPGLSARCVLTTDRNPGRFTNPTPHLTPTHGQWGRLKADVDPMCDPRT